MGIEQDADDAAGDDHAHQRVSQGVDVPAELEPGVGRPVPRVDLHVDDGHIRPELIPLP